MSKDIALLPLLNEKTYSLSKTNNTFVFKVDSSLNKHSIKRAVEAQFDVKVLEVNVANFDGKRKRVISITAKRSNNKQGQRASFKKAYVKLAKESNLPFFEAVEEEEKKQQKTQEQINKAIEKEDRKNTQKPKEATSKRKFLRSRRGEGN